MKTAYRLLDCPVNELDDLYIGVVDFHTFDASEMVDYIKDMDEPDIDALYSVNEYPSDDMFFKLADGNYYRPTEFVEMHKPKPTTVYSYGMRLRGFSIGCQPMKGLLFTAEDESGRYHDLLVYNRKLTDKELSDYELDYIGEGKAVQEKVPHHKN